MRPFKYIVIIMLLFLSRSVYALDTDGLKQNVTDFYLLSEVNDTEVKLLLNNMTTNYSFKDIDYTMRRKSNWQPRTHLKRLITLATAYKKSSSSYYNSPKIAKAIVGALNYWSYNNFYSNNWWHQEIGVPQSLGPTLIICESIIPDSTMTRSLALMDKSKIYMTGQNKIWLSGNVFMRALVRGNDSLIHTAANTIKSVMVPSKPYEEGIQPDYSFHQHGPQPQFGNYGLHFAEDIIKWMFIFNKTAIAFSPKKVSLMRKLMFKGQQKLVYKGKYEILATGRQIFPEMVNGVIYRGPKSKAKLYKKLETIFKSFDTANTPSTAPYEYVHFRNSDYSLYRTNRFFSAVRMSSQRVIGAEAGNGENLLGYYLGDGTNLIYRSGNEYHEIYPVWNWKKLPGTTTVQDTAQIPVLTWSGYKNNAHFAGGITHKNAGLTAFKYRRDSLQANKSYFFIENKVYALGSAISTSRDFNVVTTINQCYKNGKIAITKKQDEIATIWHDSIAYISLSTQKINLKDKPQSGNWKRVLNWHTDSLITKNIFHLEVDHGIKPSNNKYAYVSVVGISEKEAKRIGKTQLGKIIAHTNAVHALSFNNGQLISISAFQPCEVPINKKQKLIIKSPCLVIITKNKEGYTIDAVDPTQQQKELLFAINGKYQVKGRRSPKTLKNLTTFKITTPNDMAERGKKNSVVLVTQ